MLSIKVGLHSKGSDKLEHKHKLTLRTDTYQQSYRQEIVIKQQLNPKRYMDISNKIRM